MDPISISFEHLGNNQIIHINNQHAFASVSLHGGHVLSFTPKKDQRERLWMSPINDLATSNSIRGGVPICWPWFADMKPNNDVSLPMHGLLRTRLWQLFEIKQLDNGDTLLVLQQQVHNDEGFPHKADIRLDIIIGEQLALHLHTCNNGKTDIPLTAALHTYFAVEKLSDIELLGISGPYRDKTKGMASFDTPDNYRITEETDRIHTGNVKEIEIREGNNITRVTHAGNDSAVIWNPGKVATQSVANIPDDAYDRFICIESAITEGILISPDSTHTLTQIIS